MTGVYSQAGVKGVLAWERVHANGERTQVYVLPAGERFVAFAVDVDPVEFGGGESETIGYSTAETDATEHAMRWMEKNPRGVAGDGGGGGLAAKIVSGLKKLDQSANPADANAETEETQ